MSAHAAPGRRAWLRLLCALWAACMLLGSWSPAKAQAQVAASEAGIKAAYLYKFLPYVDWPPSAMPADGQPFVIAVVAADRVAEELRALVAGRHTNAHPVEVRQLGEGESMEGLHVLFIGLGRKAGPWVERLKGRPVLVVTDDAPNLDQGSMLNFVPVAGKVRFEAVPQAAERAGLKLGARMLAVAERVVMR